MKINEPQSIQRINPYKQQSSNGKGIIKSEKQAAIKDEVSISDEALQMAQSQDTDLTLGQGARKDRIDHINQIKQSIQDGTYQPDTREVARKIYDSFAKQS